MQTYLIPKDLIDNASPFGFTAVEGFLSVEKMLAESLLHVPYCNEHKSVWSHQFARIILEVGSQIDSLWKATTTKEDAGTDGEKLEIRDHFRKFASRLLKQKIVLFSTDSTDLLSPFEGWTASKPPVWWTAYNKIKHDRYKFNARATMENAIKSVAGLFLAILYSGQCDYALIATNCLNASSNYNPFSGNSGEKLMDAQTDRMALIDSVLFAHPIGVFNSITGHLPSCWLGSNFRFNVWWLQNRRRVYSIAISG